MGRISDFPKMKLGSIFAVVASVYAGAGKRSGYEIWNDQGEVAYVDDMETGREMVNMNFGVAERGPRECMGKKIPTIPNGYFVCHRNLNNSGNKKGKKKKCRFHCDKGYIIDYGKAKGKGKDAVIKCDSKSGGRGWLTKPKKLACKKKKSCNKFNET